MREKTNLELIEFWSRIYEFSFQFWGDANNNVYINKGGIELASFGGEDTIDEIFKRAIEWCEKQNPNGYKPPAVVIHRCQNCGSKIAAGNDFCGECLCEDDCDY